MVAKFSKCNRFFIKNRRKSLLITIIVPNFATIDDVKKLFT